MMKRFASALLAATAGLALGTGAAVAQELKIYNWSDYIAEDTIPTFNKDTGINVTYDVFDSNEVLEAKLLAGGTGFDLVVPSGAFLERQIQAGVFQKLDKSKLPNLKNMDQTIMERVAGHDPDNAHSIPYLWGTTGLGYNVGKVKEIMPDAPTDSWDMLFKPEIAAKFKDCGIQVLDAPSELMEIGLNYLGLDPHTDSRDDYKKVQDLWMSVRPYISKFHSSQYINDLANGDACLVLGWSGDILQARDRAAEAGQGVEVAYSIPKEGTVVWFDLFAIPADAKNVDEAHQFLNYLMDPAVIANITNYVAYANPNAASQDLVDPEIKADPGIYPTDEVKKRLFPDKAASAKLDRMRTRALTAIKTGQ